MHTERRAMFPASIETLHEDMNFMDLRNRTADIESQLNIISSALETGYLPHSEGIGRGLELTEDHKELFGRLEESLGGVYKDNIGQITLILIGKGLYPKLKEDK